MLGVARGDSLEPRAQPPRSAAPICAFPSVRHAAIGSAVLRRYYCTRARFGVSCELHPPGLHKASLADTRFLTAVLFVSIHIVKQYKPPHSRRHTHNAPLLPFTAVAELVLVLLEAFALANTCFTQVPNARLSQV